MPNDFTRFPRFTFSSIDRKPRSPLDPSSFIEGASLCGINSLDREGKKAVVSLLKRSCQQSNLAMMVSSGGRALMRAPLSQPARRVLHAPGQRLSLKRLSADPWANSLLELEHSRRQVALTGIGKDCHDGLALVLGALRELACSPHGGTR